MLGAFWGGRVLAFFLFTILYIRCRNLFSGLKIHSDTPVYGGGAFGLNLRFSATLCLACLESVPSCESTKRRSFVSCTVSRIPGNRGKSLAISLRPIAISMEALAELPMLEVASDLSPSSIRYYRQSEGSARVSEAESGRSGILGTKKDTLPHLRLGREHHLVHDPRCHCGAGTAR